MNLCASPRKNSLMDENNLPAFKKRRRQEWQNEVYKFNVNSNIMFTNGDRFIPNRFKPKNVEYNLKYTSKNEEKDILVTDLSMSSSYWRQHSFVKAMNDVFHVRPTRLMQFSNVQAHLAELQRRTYQGGDWPCTPRSRPMAFANATHEMSELCSTFNRNLMDWSVTGQMAVSFGQDIIIWNNQGETTMVFNVNRPRSLKYSPMGRYLAIGCMESQYPVLELWKLQGDNEFIVADGKYFPQRVESVCCIEWSTHSDRIVCGMGSGLIVVLKLPSMRSEQKLRNHSHSITCIRHSPNGLYLATADDQGHIYIYNSMLYKVIVRLRAKSGDIMFDWHPWSGVDLAISEKSPPSIYIFQVARREIVAVYQRDDRKIMINSINFNKITGELLVNVYRNDDNGCISSEILVLASLNRVVDILSQQERGLQFMLWSPDGTKLATAGLDESFSIWNFYPPDKIARTKAKKTIGQKPKSRSALDLYRLFK